MSILRQVTPTNLFSEKEKFFQDTTYNPQFTYKIATDPELLQVWGVPKENLYLQAKRILEKHAFDTDDTAPTTQPIVTKQQVIEAINAFNKECEMDPPLGIVFSEELPVRCSINSKNIEFQLPLRYTEEHFGDLCRHELETHMLRRLNHTKQPWAHIDIPEKDIRRTEEGLANLHSHLFRSDKLVYKSYATYYAAYISQHASFSEIYHALRKLDISVERSWLIAFRNKRGIEDTSKPGCFTKDICYLEGSIDVWEWIMRDDNDPRDLYLGRLPLHDLETYKKTAVTSVKYPSFFNDMNAYKSLIKEIGTINEYHTLMD